MREGRGGEDMDDGEKDKYAKDGMREKTEKGGG